ncbi:MAG: hypothetical protein IT426_06435 [Pirellulales bacterium]|nr:hypothetical protein [Pirellulales bacterium]
MIRSRTTSKRPRGLAPLEMVIALPILLGIMALMVCYGNAVCWKVRALAVARHSIWGNLTPRLRSPDVPYDRKTGFNDPRPDYWNADRTSSGTQNLAKALEVTDQEVPRHPVVRGESDGNPVLPIANGQSVLVNADLLDPSLGMRSGTAELTQTYPMLKNLGSFDLNAETEILDGAWRIAEMGIPNHHFRLNLIYPTFQPPSGNNPVLPVLLSIYNAIYGQGQLALLYGREADFIKYQTLYGQPIPRYINSVPGWTRLRFGCNMEPAVVGQAVDELVDRIDGSRRRIGPLASMSQALKGYYQSVQGRIRGLMQAVPPPPAGQLSQMQSDLDTLDGYIQLLDQFIASL